jgi:hypothetical protein
MSFFSKFFNTITGRRGRRPGQIPNGKTAGGIAPTPNCDIPSSESAAPAPVKQPAEVQTDQTADAQTVESPADPTEPPADQSNGQTAEPSADGPAELPKQEDQ